MSSRGRGKPDSSPAATADSVGSLLAEIANLIADALRIFSFTDKRHWGQDEHEQVRALEEVLDEARKDFQELSPLVNGQIYYENDRTHLSLEELRALREGFYAHVSCFKDWSRLGGPIDPIWIRTTHYLQRDLHRAQYRAARRIFTSGPESSTRCLGAFLVHRTQRAWSNKAVGVEEGAYQDRYLEELRMCKRVGSFQRFGDQDIAFVCDFCDGHLVWDDLEKMPSVRTIHEDDSAWPAQPATPTAGNPQWQATGFSQSTHEEKQILFGPVAIANHAAPYLGDWMAKTMCPFCEADGAAPLDKDDEEDLWKPDGLFEDITAFQEHLEWQHTAAPSAAMPSTNNCVVM
jgi:hypothetical protein